VSRDRPVASIVVEALTPRRPVFWKENRSMTLPSSYTVSGCGNFRPLAGATPSS